MSANDLARARVVLRIWNLGVPLLSLMPWFLYCCFLFRHMIFAPLAKGIVRASEGISCTERICLSANSFRDLKRNIGVFSTTHSIFHFLKSRISEISGWLETHLFLLTNEIESSFHGGVSASIRHKNPHWDWTHTPSPRWRSSRNRKYRLWEAKNHASIKWIKSFWVKRSTFSVLRLRAVMSSWEGTLLEAALWRGYFSAVDANQ